MNNRVRVMIADDHPIVREGLRAVLSAQPDIELVGTAASGREAVDMAAACSPHVIVMDLHMPELDGVQATKAVLAADPGVAVLVLTMFDDDEMLVSAIKAGARGYLLKGASHADILHALRSVTAGGAVFGSGVVDLVMGHLTGHGPRRSFPQLTARELEVLELLASGAGNQEIAGRLYLSPKTIRNHVANVLAKLAVPDRAQAIVVAREAGLGGDVA